MTNPKVVAIISLTVIAALFGLYAIFAKTNTTTETDPSQHEVGGVGDDILKAACKLLKINC